MHHTGPYAGAHDIHSVNKSGLNKDKNGHDGSKLMSNSSRMRSKHHRPSSSSGQLSVDGRHAQSHEARQKAGRLNNGGGGPLSNAAGKQSADERSSDASGARGAKTSSARYHDTVDNHMAEEARDCAEILDFVFAFKARKRQKTDDEEPINGTSSQVNGANES